MKRAITRWIVACCLGVGGWGGGPCALAAAAAPLMLREAPPSEQLQDFREIVQQAKLQVFPAVIFIRSLRETHEAGKKISHEVSGSGVIISAEGEALTNWHVIDKSVKVRCQLSDGRVMDATIVGSDKSTDLALLRLQPRSPRDGGPLPFAGFGDSSALQEGDFVMAMGAPWGLNRSVSIGIISCTKRYLPETSEYSHWLQTDAAINPGNSGGPLVNTQGRIIGLNARGMSAGDGMGFAIPAQTINMLLPDLREHGKVPWSWTGLQLQALRDFNRNMYFDAQEGVLVAETDPESPARRAGFMPRDRIIRAAGHTLTALTEEDLPSVRRQLALLPMHQAAKFEIMRGKELLTLDLTPREKGKVEGEELDCPRWDLTVKAINQFDNEDLYFHRKQGVFVYGVKYPGNAGAAGLRNSDIILKIDGKDVVTLDDVKAIHQQSLENVATKHRIVFVVLRSGLMNQVVLDFSRDYSKD